MNLLDDFVAHAERHPDRIAIVDRSGARINYGSLERRSARLAAAFAAWGIGKGDRVLVGLFPGIDLYSGLAALWRLGAVVVFPEPAIGLAGFRHAAAVTAPKALLASPAIRALAFVLPETRRIPLRLSTGMDTPAHAPFASLFAGDPALISFTSGSTGAPKAIERSHGFMGAQHRALSPLIAPEGESEVDLVAFPAFVLTCLGHGITAVMPSWNVRRHDRVRPTDIAGLAQREGATRLLVPPVVVDRLVGTPLPRTVRRVLTGGGPLYPDVARRFLAKAPSVGLTVVYGSTEAEPIAHERLECLADEIWEKAASGGGLPVGKPVDDIVLKIVDDEILVTGPHVNRGYLDPAQDRETKIGEGDAIWHRTGDAGALDQAGRLWLLGRHSSAAGGIFPFSVETAARLWPGVTGAAFAVDHDGRLVLFLTGDSSSRAFWHRRAHEIGKIDVEHVERIPMDRRHRSKPDYKLLLACHRARPAHGR